jgi:parallel beta-helix repeat protein
VINVTSTGWGIAHNATVNDTYPLQVIYLASQPTPLSGTNNTWIIGNLSANKSVLVNITVLVINITNGTVINNTANVTIHNETSVLLNYSATQTTTIKAPIYNFSNITVAKTDSPDPVYSSTNLSYVINVTSTGPGIAHNITVTEVYPNQTIYLAAQPTPVAETNNTWIIGNISANASVLVNITVLAHNLTNGTLINNTVNVSFQNETSIVLNQTAEQNTTVLYGIQSCPVTINQSTNLTQNLTSTGSCITVGADNVVLDCKGHTINFSTNPDVIGGYGVRGELVSNIEVRDCRIVRPTVDFCEIGPCPPSSGAGIYFKGGENLTLINNTISVRDGNGILLEWNNNNTFYNNTATSQSGNGISTGASNYNLLVDNIAEGTSTTSGSTTYTMAGIKIGNGKNAFGDDMPSYNSILHNNTAISNNGIAFEVPTAEWIILEPSMLTNITAENCTFTTNSGTALILHSHNNSFANITLYSNSTWAYVPGFDNNLTKTTFIGSNGSIAILPEVVIP